MKIISNDKLIARNKKIGQVTTFISLGVLVLGFIATFNQQFMNWSMLALVIGFILSQIGIYYGSRWGKSPRPDELISAALKGLGDKFNLYHYMTDVSHLLIGPAGIWVLLPYAQKGTITFDETKNRWKQKGGSFYMKLFAQESLGRPDADVRASLASAEKSLIKAADGEFEIPPIQAALVFTNDRADVSCPNAPVLTIHAEKIKDYLRKTTKENPIPAEMVALLQQKLPQESIPLLK
jgi:hypothetical protein